MNSSEKAWQGKMLARIDKYEASTAATGKEIDITGVVERDSLKIIHGTKDFKAVQLMNEGNIYSHDPEGMTEITFTMYTRHLDYGGGSPEKIFYGSSTADGTSINKIEPSQLIDDRVMCRVVIAFTNQSALDDPAAIIGGAAGDKTKRYIFADCYMVSMNSERADNLWKTDVVLKCAPADADGDLNYELQSVESESTGDAIPALADYGSSKKW
jgi:hypothetical protein